MAKKTRLKSGFTLGGEQAEADPLAEEAFVETSLYEIIDSRRDPRCFLVGRTGSGKSAALQHLEERHPDRVVRISPEDLSLPYITDLQVIKYMDSLDVKLDLFWIALWKHVLLVEIIRRRYKINSPEAKQKFITGLREKLRRDPGKEEALQYLDEFEGRFWVEADERVRQITNTFRDKIDGEANLQLGTGPLKMGGTLGKSHEEETESRAELADRFQRIVNQTQLSKLNRMMTVLDEEILDQAHFTYVVIDDLDRHWVDERISNDLVRCLFRTVLDMQKVTHLKVLVALRTNIFQELDFGRSGGQEEKFRSLVLEMKWTNANLEEVLDERVKVSSARGGLEALALRELLPHANRARGNPIDYLLDRTLMRPRDAIAFANECLAEAAGKASISWDAIQTAERSYSAKRLLALRDEWKGTYPGIDAVVEKFRASPGRMTIEDLERRLDDCMLLISDPAFTGVRWMTEVSRAMWESSIATASWYSLYQPLLSVLYRIGVIGCAPQSAAAPVFFSGDPFLVDSESSLVRCKSFYVHRMFQKALDVRLARDGE
ncbi:MAG: hypothetical protein ABI435_07495 [Pseudolysinimonas sp.]